VGRVGGWSEEKEERKRKRKRKRKKEREGEQEREIRREILARYGDTIIFYYVKYFYNV
jgi:hypothetical protein